MSNLFLCIPIDELPYTILSYANGPGNELNAGANGLRKDLSGKTLGRFCVDALH